MKLVIVTSVEEYEKEVIKLFKASAIDSFSGLNIDGYKHNAESNAASWFPSIKGGTESHMFFSFTEISKIDNLFKEIEKFNASITTNNPLRGVVLPIEKHI